MPRLVTFLEANVRFRDGKKWKQRYCKLVKPESKSGSITMYITKQFGNNAPNPIINEKLSGHYLFDEITGFEYGRHVDKEGSVMALIGRNVVYCIAFSQNDTMFRWAENLKKYFKCANFHVTLKKVSETSGLFNKITSGIQGNLHLQSMRLCLIGEPADGNKFICEWTTANINSIDINDTDCDKVKELIIQSNSKLQKSKGHFEFEISVPQNNNIFTESFETFLKYCQDTNEDFRTNFKIKRDSVDTNTDTTSFSYSILYPEMNCSNSDNSSSLEKRSSEIPIPRSREHSGPDQRPIDNVQIKIRKSNKNFAKVLKENKKHSSLIETNRMFDHNTCLFDDDEEIADQFDNKVRNFLCNGLSQESSGVYVNGASSSLREPNLSARILNQDDSGCGNLSSTSSTHNYVPYLPNVLPPRLKKVSSKENVILSFYRSIIRNPLLLSNYKKYYQLLRVVSDSSDQIIKRSNSFNCVHLCDKSQFGYSRKYSNSNFPLNLNYQISDQNFHYWKKKIVNKISENERSYSSKNESDYFKPSSSHSLLNRLPFKSSKDFHNSVIKSMQNGTACLYLFCYHHFLMLLNDLKIILKNLECKQKSFDAVLEDNKFKNINNSKQNIYNRWLEKIQSEYSKSFDVDNRSKRASILDINLILIYEIASNIFHSKKCDSAKHGSCECILRHSCFMTNPTIELNNEKCLLKRVEEQIFKPSFKESPMYLNTGLVISSSSSTPDFRCYNQSNKVSKQQKKSKEIKYQNISSLDTFDTMNHTFPKQSISLNKPDSSESKGGSFKKFRRKYSPGFLMPFFHLGSSKFSNTMFTRRKTPSTHSTLSEPICHLENKDQNNYYNIGYQKQSYTKRSLSVVFDSSFPYEEPKECHNYINVQNDKGLTYKTDNDSNSYICSGPSSIFDDDSYPEEILDPSRNYGDLHFVKSNCSKMKSLRQDSENHNLFNPRRASMSLLSNKSFHSFSTSRPTSFRAQHGGYSNISQNNSDDISSNNNSGNANISDFANGNVIRSSSPQSSSQSCSPGSILSSQKTVPRSLNYVTVMENNYSQPLSIYPPIDYSGHEYSSDIDSHRRMKSHNFKRIGITPQPSPIVDYCQIDLTGTYALKAVHQMVLDKTKSRDKDSISKTGGGGGSPEDLESNNMNLDQTDNYSISSSSFTRERKNKHLPSNKKCFRRFFSRKPESTN